MAEQPPTTNTSADDASKTFRIPVCVAAASASAIAAWSLAFIAGASDMSLQAVIVVASFATIAGCSVLAAIVVVCCRNACRKLQTVLAAKLTAQVEQLTDDMVASFGAIRAELLEQHKQTRQALFAAAPEGPADLHVVK